ncbi:hypothetical protein GBF38_008440, partial [Nibea albiflora]
MSAPRSSSCSSSDVLSLHLFSDSPGLLQSKDTDGLQQPHTGKMLLNKERRATAPQRPRDKNVEQAAALSELFCGGADADAARSQMPIEDDETICAERKGISLQGLCVSQLRCAACDREPGAVRLAAVEPEEADGLMLLLVRLGAA